MQQDKIGDIFDGVWKLLLRFILCRLIIHTASIRRTLAQSSSYYASSVTLANGRCHTGVEIRSMTSIIAIVHCDWDVERKRRRPQFIEFLWQHSIHILCFLLPLCDSGVCAHLIQTLAIISSRLGQSHLIGSLLYPPALLSQWELWKWKIIIATLTPCHQQIANFWGEEDLLLLVSWKNSHVFKYRQGCQSFIEQSLCKRKTWLQNLFSTVWHFYELRDFQKS